MLPRKKSTKFKSWLGALNFLSKIMHEVRMKELKILDGYEWMDPEEADAKVESLYQAYLNISKDSTSDDELRIIFDLIEGLIFVRDFARLADVLNDARERLYVRLDANPDDESAIDKLVDLNHASIRFLSPSPSEFVEKPFYEEIIRRCEGKTGKPELRKKQAEIGLVNHYLNWVATGGQTDDAYLVELAANLENEAAAYLEKTTGQPEFRIPYRRSLAHFHLQNGKPNEAVAQLKAALEEAPTHPKFAPTDAADFNLEIGTILANHNKHQAALKYFEAAFDIYEKAGEDYEIYALQAEAWINECKELS